MRIFISSLLSLFSLSIIAQDTIMVQAWNFNSVTRDTVITFPDLDHNEYEKIVMLYTMRCKDALVSTGSDRNRGCGEWDYSCNTSIIDSSRVDSLKATHPTYIITGFDGNIFEYTTQEVHTYTEYYQKEVEVNSVNNRNDYPIANGNMDLNHPFGSDEGPAKSYYLINTDSYPDLTAGDISGISFSSLELEGDYDFVKVKFANTSSSVLDANVIMNADFEELYFLNTTLSSSNSDLIFHKAFNWSGDGNIIVELSYNRANNTSGNISGDQSGEVVSAYTTGQDSYLSLNESYNFDIPTDNMGTITDEVTVAFWNYGNEQVLPKNTSAFHANDANGVRQLNAHLPWSNSQVYWDCGNDGSGYDRINKLANLEDFAGKWNHWAFTKNAVTGSMKIYLNGSLWHSGTGKNKTMDVQQFSIGSSSTNSNYYNGDIDDFSIWDVELDEAEILALMHEKLDSNHPQFSNLVSYYDFNEGQGDMLSDKSSYQSVAQVNGLPIWRKFSGSKTFKGLVFGNELPNMSLISGDFDLDISFVTLRDSTLIPPSKVVAYSVDGTDLVEDDPVYYWEAGITSISNEAGELIETIDVPAENSLFIFDLSYFRKNPAKYELLSFVTPYGIGLDFGFNGVTWPFDLTDFGPIMKGEKRLLMDRGGQWQEEMDIKFMFIKGTPPRNVIDIHQVWPLNSNGYQSLLSNDRLEPRDISIESGVEHVKLRVATTGHGQEGEFIPRDHIIDINGGFDEFRWQVWTECSDNPVFPQGGTWIYDRAGWCPGAPTILNEWDITPIVLGDPDFNIDYGLSTASGNSNYIINTQVVKYGPNNFGTDASLDRIISPSMDVEYTRENPICGNPSVLIRNNGSNVLGSLDIYYGIVGGGTSKYTWNGSLAFGDTKVVELPAFGDGQWNKSNEFFAFIERPNGGTDEYVNNNRLESEFVKTSYISGDLIVDMRSNFAPLETRWFLRDTEGNIVASKTSGLFANQVSTDTITGLNGCYELQFTDSDQDGISWWANNDGNGYVRLRGTDTGWIVLQPDFGKEISYRFTVGTITDTDESALVDTKVTLFPNPASDFVNIELEGVNEAIAVELVGSTGKIFDSIYKENINPVYDQVSFNLREIPAGTYFIKIENQEESVTKKLVIVH